MMLEAGRVLGQAGLLKKWSGKESRKGADFEQPLKGQQHGHLDVSHINICSASDGNGESVRPLG
jgi:hypothetical protein